MKTFWITIGSILLVVVWAFIAQWAFNHVNAWVGVGCYVIGAILALYFLIKSLIKLSK